MGHRRYEGVFDVLIETLLASRARVMGISLGLAESLVWAGVARAGELDYLAITSAPSYYTIIDLGTLGGSST